MGFSVGVAKAFVLYLGLIGVVGRDVLIDVVSRFEARVFFDGCCW